MPERATSRTTSGPLGSNGDHARTAVSLWRTVWRTLFPGTLASQFMLGATAVVFTLMLVLGYWANSRLENAILKSAGEFGAVYIESFLERYVQNMTPEGTLPPYVHRQIDGRMNSNVDQRQIVSVKIWNRDGIVIYSDEKANIGLKSTSDDLANAFAGRVVTSYEESQNDDADRLIEVGVPLVEIYTPLRDRDTGEIVAVGEFYQQATSLQAEIRRLETWTWLLVAVTAIPMLGLLHVLVRRGSKRIEAQDLQLRIQLQEANELAAQNARLRRSADKARVDSTRTNETLLGRIGSDLHDGPVQLLSLLILKLGARSGAFADGQMTAQDRAESDREIIALAEEIMTEIRTVSAGLSLPELEHLSLAEVVNLAVNRHENLTGTSVVTDIGTLPSSVSHPVKICAYRIVQEGLSNAVKHAGGVGQHVAAHSNAEEIELVVSDQGPGMSAHAAEGLKGATASHGLGLKGMRNRIRAFAGRLDVQSSREGGTRITAHIPQL
jgi:signal transduction histidine kinase